MIGFRIEVLGQENCLIGLRYELMHAMEGLTLEKVPVFQDFMIFSIGFLFITLSLVIRTGETYTTDQL